MDKIKARTYGYLVIFYFDFKKIMKKIPDPKYKKNHDFFTLENLVKVHMKIFKRINYLHFLA